MSQGGKLVVHGGQGLGVQGGAACGKPQIQRWLSCRAEWIGVGERRALGAHSGGWAAHGGPPMGCLVRYRPTRPAESTDRTELIVTLAFLKHEGAWHHVSHMQYEDSVFVGSKQSTNAASLHACLESPSA